MILVFVFAVAPLLWIALAIGCFGRQAMASKLPSRFFAVVLFLQFVVMALPLVIYNWSVSAAGLSDFIGCLNGQEYCDEFYQLERIGDRMFFHLGAAFWVGNVIWGFALSATQRFRARLSGT